MKLRRSVVLECGDTSPLFEPVTATAGTSKRRRVAALQGVALVITLIMLTVITLIAVAFLALSQRERSSISQTITGTDTELALNTALDRAKAQIVAQMNTFVDRLAFTNANGIDWTNRLILGPDLLISVTDASTNVLFSTPGKIPADLRALTNLLEDPQVPVFVTNRASTNLIFVSYLDLNRNGRFDDSGNVFVRDQNGRLLSPRQTNYVIGDPEWVGVLARPNERHSSSNRFVARFAYLVVPAGRTLAIDFSHNQGKKSQNQNMINGFYRRQGHGSWEINLAAFLTDLNPNFWNGYDYNPGISFPSAGVGFDDASEILNYRYNGRPLQSALDIFGTVASAFEQDNIDQYADGSASDNDLARLPWPGAPNPQHFFSVHDFFNPKTPDYQRFRERMSQAGSSFGTFDAYTFYRMLAQLGTDSVPEKPSYFMTNEAIMNLRDKGPINLNYNNVKYSPGNEITAAQFQSWSPEEFVQVVADRLFRDHGLTNYLQATPLSITNLPVYALVNVRGTNVATNYYTATVHRILQMALNIYDATTAKVVGTPDYPYYPTVLQPLYSDDDPDRIRIIGYREMGTSGPEMGITNAFNWHDLNDPQRRRDLMGKPNFVYGVPVLIGAKKGYPNFNEFVFQSDVQFERRVEVWKEAQTSLPTSMGQMFFVGVSNSFGLEAWNSYANTFPRDLDMFGGVEISSTLTDVGISTFTFTNTFAASNLTTIRAAGSNPWRGRQFRAPVPLATNLWTNHVFIPYRAYQDGNFFTTNNFDVRFPTPQLVLSNHVKVRFFLFDNGHLVDAVGLAPVSLSTNVTEAVHGGGLYARLWDTNRVAGPGSLRNVSITKGVEAQLLVSQGQLTLGQNIPWDNFGQFRHTPFEKEGFRTFLNVASNSPIRVTNQAPFTPQVKIYRRVHWRANDPLVHYMDEDLRWDRESKPQFSGASLAYAGNRLNFDLGRTNAAYEPWGGDGKTYAAGREHLWDPSVIDPSIENSDRWDFPTNQFPSIGALGRVHRGTPWQTIYFKSLPASRNRWTNIHASVRSHPTNDWRLADIFTVAQHPNASRGRLSVNQTNVAAWSAVLSGIEVSTLTNKPAGLTVETKLIEPVLNEPEADRLVEGINAYRESLPGKVFTSVAELLAVPELTTNSPYLTPPYAASLPRSDQNLLRDEDYERIPQAILSLIKPGEPRFEIYVFGQSLKPATQSVIPGGNYRGLCVNYEVTGELAARAVVRVEFDRRADPRDLRPRPRAVIESFNILPPD